MSATKLSRKTKVPTQKKLKKKRRKKSEDEDDDDDEDEDEDEDEENDEDDDENKKKKRRKKKKQVSDKNANSNLGIQLPNATQPPLTGPLSPTSSIGSTSSGSSYIPTSGAKLLAPSQGSLLDEGNGASYSPIFSLCSFFFLGFPLFHFLSIHSERRKLWKMQQQFSQQTRTSRLFLPPLFRHLAAFLIVFRFSYLPFSSSPQRIKNSNLPQNPNSPQSPHPFPLPLRPLPPLLLPMRARPLLATFTRIFPTKEKHKRRSN
jgi:hypothetical protein